MREFSDAVPREQRESSSYFPSQCILGMTTRDLKPSYSIGVTSTTSVRRKRQHLIAWGQLVWLSSTWVLHEKTFL